MIGRLVGILVERGLDGACVIDVSGVGYEVLVPIGTLGKLPQGTELVTLHVHTHVREDEITLYGFATLEDRAAFRVLLSVSGIGPRLAIAVLSALDAKELARAIARDDRAAFKGISGVGKKTVERILLELKDKLIVSPSSAGSLISPVPTSAPRRAGVLGTVVATLIQLGYKPSEAERAAAALEDHSQDKTVEQLLRDALAVLAS